MPHSAKACCCRTSKQAELHLSGLVRRSSTGRGSPCCPRRTPWRPSSGRAWQSSGLMTQPAALQGGSTAAASLHENRKESITPFCLFRVRCPAFGEACTCGMSHNYTHGIMLDLHRQVREMQASTGNPCQRSHRQQDAGSYIIRLCHLVAVDKLCCTPCAA